MKRGERYKARVAGLKTYFTGSPCKQGHVSARRTSNLECVECARLRIKRPEVLARKREENRRYRDRDPEAWRERSRRWRAENPGKTTGLWALWKKVNPEKNHEAQLRGGRKYRAANPEKCKGFSRSWWRKNHDLMIIYAQQRRARKRKAEGVFTKEDIKRIRKLQRNCCAEPTCRRSLKKTKAHIDHIVALSKGGTNWPKNLQLLCGSCNSSKGARDPIEHARIKGRLL